MTAPVCQESCCRPTATSMPDRMAEQLDRQAFAARVVLQASGHEHVSCPHSDCKVHHGPCLLCAALKASVEQINRDGQALANELRLSVQTIAQP